MKVVNSRDVAQYAGCSQSTVSRVMNSDPRISRTTRARVLEAARALGYDMKRSSGCWNIGVVTGFDPECASGYYASMLAAVCREIKRRGLHVELLFQDELGNCDYGCCRGIIDLYQTPQQILCDTFTVPVVTVNNHCRKLDNIRSVVSDSKAGMKLAVQYLWNLGHRDIRFISAEGKSSEEMKPTRRWQGFLEAMNDAGVKEPERYGIFFSEGKHTSQELIKTALAQAVSQGCTAFITVNALHTPKISSAFHALQIKIPEEVSLIDWEYEGVSEYLEPPRTAIAVDYTRVAAEAVDLLTEILEKKNAVFNRTVPPKLIVRKSCAAIRQE